MKFPENRIPIEFEDSIYLLRIEPDSATESPLPFRERLIHHLYNKAQLKSIPEITEKEIDEMFPLEAERFMFKASDSYNKAQEHRREGAKAIIKLMKKR